MLLELVKLFGVFSFINYLPLKWSFFTCHLLLIFTLKPLSSHITNPISSFATKDLLFSIKQIHISVFFFSKEALKSLYHCFKTRLAWCINLQLINLRSKLVQVKKKI